jgi:hypothetical protein
MPFSIGIKSRISDALLRFDILPIPSVPPRSGAFLPSPPSSTNKIVSKSVEGALSSVFKHDSLESPPTWRRGRDTRDDVKDDRRVGMRHISNKQSNVSSIPSTVTINEDSNTSSVVSVTYSLLLSALCVDQPISSASPPLTIDPLLSIYRNLLLSLSISYPTTLLSRDNKRCNYHPRFLSSLFLHLKSPMSPSPSSSKQFLFRLLSPLIPHSDILSISHNDIEINSTTNITDELLGFHLSMSDFMTIVIDGMKDKDHQVKLSLLSVALHMM